MNFKLKLLSLSIGLSGLSMAMPSYALLITSTVESSASIKVNNGQTYSDTNGPSSSSTNSTLFNTPDFQYPYGGSSATADVAGNGHLLSMGPWYAQTKNWFGSGFSFETKATATYQAMITNDSSTAQNVSFNFLIKGGVISGGNSDAGVTAGYSANISRDSNSLWYSTAQTTSGGYGNSTLSQSGVDLSLSSNCCGNPSYNWGMYQGTLDLGVLNAGQTLSLEYSFSTYINEAFIDDGYSYTPYAEFDDPFDFNSSPIFAENQFVTSPVDNNANVPEPSGLGLAAIGLAALAFRRRPKKAQH